MESAIEKLDQRQLKIQRQREALHVAAGAWKLSEHSELAEGAAAWERRIRTLDNPRIEKLERSRNRK